MTQTCETPPGMAGLADTSFPDWNVRESAPNSVPNQAEISRNPRAVREVTIATILDESIWILDDLALQTSIAPQFAELRDVRGYLYCLDLIVKQAIRAGAEGVELRKVRKEMPEARR